MSASHLLSELAASCDPAIKSKVSQRPAFDQSNSLVIHTNRKAEVVHIDRILMFKADQKYVDVYLSDGRVRTISKSIVSLRARFPDDFLLVCRGSLINKKHLLGFDALDSLSPMSVNVFNVEEPVHVARRYHSTVRKYFREL